MNGNFVGTWRQDAGGVDLLAEIGRDCVGALQILPDGQTPGDVRTIDATPLAEPEVAALLRGAVAPPSMASGMAAVHNSATASSVLSHRARKRPRMASV